MQLPLFEIDSVESMTDEAVNWLRENLAGQHVLVCFSGGKDSIVTEALVKMSGISYSLNSTLTGIDPPQVTRFIHKHYPSCTFVRPHQSFWHLITTANPPGGTGRGIKWCCTKIKENPSKSIPIKHRVMGIRAEESPARAKYGRSGEFNKQLFYYPIFNWKEWQIWEFIEKHGLSYPKLYDEGFDRIGCVICPNHHSRHQPYRDRWPNHFKCFEKYVSIWWHKRQGQGRTMFHNSPEEFLKDWYAGKFYYYDH
jgi:phosphoadenosine phosphosulfate reductase